MIRINLLPYRAARRKENIRRQFSIFLLSLIFTLSALTYYHIILSNRIGTLSAEIKTTQKSLGTYQRISRDIATMKKRLQILNDKMKVIRQLELGRKEPLHLLETMTTVMISKRMWLTSLESKNNLVDIKGNALDNKTVADFMVRLEKSGLFTSVNLQTLKQYQLEGTAINLKSFEISCKWPAFAAPEKKK